MTESWPILFLSTKWLEKIQGTTDLLVQENYGEDYTEIERLY